MIDAVSWHQMRFHAMQAAAWRTRARFVSLACGRGSGKTELARRRLIRYLPVRKPWSDPIYFFALPTREQAKRVAWDKLKALVPKEWIREIRESELIISTVFGSKLFLVGMDKPQRIEGVQWDGGVIDESCDQQPGSFDRSVRPALSHRDAWCWRIGVPKRFGPGAADFKRFFDESAAGKLGSNFEAYSWPSWDILPQREIDEARNTLDEKDFQEQYGASWQNASGQIFHAFDDLASVRSSVGYDPTQPLVVGSDFNVSPMAWVIAQIKRFPDKAAELHVFDEIWAQNTNTQATLDRLFGMYGKHESGWVFFGDASSRARKTSASASDYSQIANDERFQMSKICYPTANPRIADRFAACNALLKNAAGVRRCFVHPRCKHLIDDLKFRAYEAGSRDPDTTDPDRGHITDALGYVIHYLWPVLPREDGVAQMLVGSPKG